MHPDLSSAYTQQTRTARESERQDCAYLLPPSLTDLSLSLTLIRELHRIHILTHTGRQIHRRNRVSRLHPSPDQTDIHLSLPLSHLCSFPRVASADEREERE